MYFSLCLFESVQPQCTGIGIFERHFIALYFFYGALVRDSCSLFAAFVVFMGHWGGTVVTFTAFVVFIGHWGCTFVAFTAFLAFMIPWGWRFVVFTAFAGLIGR